MNENEVGTASDVPGPWVIQVDSMNVEQARELGKVLGERGITGRFMAGEIADHMRDYAKIRHSKGGE